MMVLLEAVRKIAAQSGYALLFNPCNEDATYALQQSQAGRSCPVGIFDSLDEVIVYLMAQTSSRS